ncbi:uncharacterized protein LOC135166543 [Diachasmimorpha longicaudata]|uniref:uncharacterized protein LOC135166543 n=1 Tax=Diachasmimorpha longicaudata TaxID=58733 RepID=UPI0030B91438
MPEYKKKRSRSRSRSSDRRQKKRKVDQMQLQLDNLTKAVEGLVRAQNNQPQALPPYNGAQLPNIEVLNTEIADNKEDKENIPEVTASTNSETNMRDDLKGPATDFSLDATDKDNILKVSGVDVNESKSKKVKFHAKLKNTWSKWVKQGLPEKNKSEILESYNRKGDLFTEAPKRDQPFSETQNCIGSALIALGGAISMLIDPPGDGLDEDIFTDYLSQAGQLLTDVFFQQSLARKSFITPQLNKSIKPAVEAMISDEWHYGNDLKDKITGPGKLEVPVYELSSDGVPSEISEVPIQEEVESRCILQLSQDELSDDNPIFIKEVTQVRKPTGRLSFFIDNWRKITSDKYILSYLEGYRIPFTHKPYQLNSPKAHVFSNEEMEQLRIKIDKLLSNGAIEECTPCEDQFISSYFLVPQPDGSYRFIFNLNNLNKFIVAPHFKLEDIRAAMNLLSPNDFMGTVDLQDAYFVVPIYKHHRKFLKFEFERTHFEFTCLPFGLCTSPYIFTKIMKPVVNVLRLKGFLLVLYLDDFLFMNSAKDTCKLQIPKASKFLEDLGFLTNWEKSSVIGKRKCKYLGFVIDSVDYSLNLTDKKMKQISVLASSFQVGKSYKIRDFVKFLGVITAVCPAVGYGFIHCKILEQQKFLALKFNGGDYDASLYIRDCMLTDLNWWEQNANIGRNPIRKNNFSIEIFSDASLSGWGCYCNNVSAHGFWDEEEKNKHINYLELLAAFYALKCFAFDLFKCEILLRLDNTTAISYINRAGSVQFPHLSNLARSIWEWCKLGNLWIKASYISSASNGDADKVSRIVKVETE